MKNKPYTIEDVIYFLERRRKLSKACKEDLRKLIEFRKIPRREVLLRPGQIHRKLYFIQKGFLYSYSYNNKGQQVAGWFFGERGLVVGIDSFYHRKPSKEYIETAEDTEVFYLTRDGYEYLCKTYGEFADIARMFLQDYLVIIYQHGTLLRAHNAKEKYKWVLENMPEVLNRLTLKLVASWLKMHPSTLSRKRRGL
jgi:CRP-like cAMP-binding protein